MRPDVVLVRAVKLASTSTVLPADRNKTAIELLMRVRGDLAVQSGDRGLKLLAFRKPN